MTGMIRDAQCYLYKRRFSLEKGGLRAVTGLQCNKQQEEWLQLLVRQEPRDAK